ncbi:GNAT family N-acetyltransferase [Candidatus Fermentibacteria bacterium]|nr:GNAT family N-acetyltransferase [Candidatus Fermentibacteria bacterium]
MAQDTANERKPASITLHELRAFRDFPSWLTPEQLAVFLHESLKPFEDSPEDIRRGIGDALSPQAGEPGFILVSERDERPLGALVMLRTGMKGYIPENLLLWVAVDPSTRGEGIGSMLIRRSFELADGDVKLHVEYDNPAKRLYERLGMTSKYAEMRYTK